MFDVHSTVLVDNVLGCGFMYYVLVIDTMFIVLMTTAHEELEGGQDGGCVDKIIQKTLSK